MKNFEKNKKLCLETTQISSGSKYDGHLFKWDEDGTHEEVNKLKLEGTFLINDLKLQIENLKEEI
ncbi:hypothetical protein DY000_02013140 [Brassica cretica]|uniref:Bet v I/Major latex protein domain-containing protein n=1 Tax=Brassica cretica TaxID=69181 RepID=A0ABQ7D1Z9_BRACR|nr:hypothetical protein DY000_02013140 [Brassica cretica]